MAGYRYGQILGWPHTRGLDTRVAGYMGERIQGWPDSLIQEWPHIRLAGYKDGRIKSCRMQGYPDTKVKEYKGAVRRTLEDWRMWPYLLTSFSFLAFSAASWMADCSCLCRLSSASCRVETFRSQIHSKKNLKGRFLNHQ